MYSTRSHRRDTRLGQSTHLRAYSERRLFPSVSRKGRISWSMTSSTSEATCCSGAPAISTAAALIPSRTAPPIFRSRWSESNPELAKHFDLEQGASMAGLAQTEIPSQLGRTAVITGATGGLGYETALALAKAGAEVILTGRDDRKGQTALEKISREMPGAKTIDLASLASIAAFAQRMHARQSLDLLINNAGVMALPRRQTTADGFETQFGTNYLGHFALTARLMPLLRQASG